jgi:N4-gp56 family major capsid protein
MADPIVTNNEIQTNQLIVSYVQAKLFEQSQLLPTITDVSQFAVKGNSSIEFPIASQLVVKKKAVGAVTDGQAFSYTTDKLELNQEAYIRWTVEDRAKLQSIVDVDLDAIDNATQAHAEQVDIDIYKALYAGAGKSISFTGNTNTTLARADILGGRQWIKSSKVPNFQGNLFLAVNSTEEEDMLNISEFIDASKYGSNMPIMNGEIGMVHGVRIICSEVVDTLKPVIYHKSALFFGLQAAPTYKTLPDLKQVGTEHLLWQLFGLKVTRDGRFAAKFLKA